MNPVVSRPLLQAVILVCYWAVQAPSAQASGAGHCTPDAQPGRPTIGLALGGGGARGAAHAGVLRKLEELRIPVDYVAGTSMGAIVGGLYATGMGLDEVEAVLRDTDWTSLFNDSTERKDRPLRRKLDDELGLYGPRLGVGADGNILPGGAVAGQKVNLMLERLVSARVQVQDFNTLPIPFRAVASDLVSGEMVVLQEGNLASAMRASMSVPGLFDPVRSGDRLLVDGGLTRNLPVDVVRSMGADVVIAVNVEYPLLGVDELDGLLPIIGQLTTLMVAGNTRSQVASLGLRDTLIEPQLGTDFQSTQFERADEIIPAGYAAARERSASLARWSLTEAEYADWRKALRNCASGVPVVHFVELNNQSRFSDSVLLEKLNVATGEPLDFAALERDLRQIYALGFIRNAHYRLVERDGRLGLRIEVQQDQRGADFIESGLEITGDSRDVALDLKLAYLKTDLNERGAEFRGAVQLGREFGALAEMYMPLDDRLRWVFSPNLQASRRDVSAFNAAGDLVERWELDEVSGALTFGREFGRHAGLFLTLSHYAGDVSVNIGDPTRENFRFKGGEWSVAAIYDRLDNRFLPSRGSLAQLRYIRSEHELGADDEFEQLELGWFTARNWGRHTAWFGTTLNTTLDDNAPVYGLYTGGGFLNMSGFERDEISGQHFGFSMLGYRYKLNAEGFLPAYAGMTLEYGNAAAKREDIYRDGVLNGSVYLGYDSPLGPLYLGFGWSEENSGLLFLRLGTLLGGESVGRR
ncbi:MAG: patatin [Xanthomonadales bacterium]|nr:patatin [Xanthomonadales bacterium]